MNKTELIDTVAGETGLGRAETGRVVDAVVRNIGRALTDGEKVTLVGFGTFETTSRSAREGRNPRTGEPLKIAASRGIKFKPGNELRTALNK